MNLPRAVREQAERAEAAYQEMIGNTAKPAPAPEPVAPPVEPDTPKPQVVAEQVPAPKAESVEETKPVLGADSWELKYRVLEGKYRKEVPAMAAELRELRAQLEAALRASPAGTVDQDAGSSTDSPSSAKVREQYGDDFANAVDVIASEKSKKLRDEFSSEVEEIKRTSGEARRERFMSQLQSLVPSFAQIDQDPGFTAYLDDFDPQTGRARREFFNEADQSNDAARVASFFAAYAKGKQSAPTPVVADAPSVEHLIQPDSSRHSEAPPGKKLWTRAEVSRFYADARATGGSKPFGRYTQAEYERIDQDISLAPSEGRYVG